MVQEVEFYRCLHGGETCRFMGKKREDLDHLFENIGIRIEDNQNTLDEIISIGITQFQLNELKSNGHLDWISDEQDVKRINWLPSGELIYKKLIRRHRLAERLLVDILGIPLGTEEQTSGPACQLDHSLPDEVANSICTLLGHPSQCPHNHPIPPGECCVKKEYAIKPLWIPLTRATSGKEYQIHTILDEPSAEHLIRLGITIGSRLWIKQTQPTIVLDCEQTTVACDQEIAQHVFVRPVP